MQPIFKKAFSYITKLCSDKAFLLLLNGFILASLFYFYTNARYEDQLFKALAANVASDLPAHNPARQDSIFFRSLNLTHRLIKRRTSIFLGTDLSGWETYTLHPVSFDLMTGQGACGSNAYVLGRILQEFDIDVRFPQMKANGVFGGHIVLEAKNDKGWKVLDAMYDLSFTRPDGEIASFKDVQSDWSYYKSQVPSGYDTSYKYEDVRYANWDKIPVVFPLLKQMFYLVKGKEFTDTFSFRPYILSKYKTVFNLILFFYIVLTVIILRKIIREKKAKNAGSDGPDSLQQGGYVSDKKAGELEKHIIPELCK